MIDRSEIWRRRSWIWWLPLLFVFVNVGLLAFYQTSFAGKLDVLADSFNEQAEVLDSFRTERRKVEDFLLQVETQESQARSLYRDYFATRGERHTLVLREIRTLGRRAGLDPTSFAYSNAEVRAIDINRLGIQFAVTGTYDQLRTFINFLELTDQFLVLDRVSLSGGMGDRDAQLEINMGVITYFSEHDAPELVVTEEEMRQAQRPPAEGEASSTEGDGEPGAPGSEGVVDPQAEDEEEET